MKSQKIVVVLFLLAIACSKDDDTIIPSEFSGYVERFVAEGQARSVATNTHDLSVTFISQSDLPGYCGQGQVDPPRVSIVNTDNCWNKRSDMDKEILLFHELGHAILRRQHTNDTLPNGDYKSMMFGGNQFGVYTSNTPEKRQYYLDELFNPSAPIPDWARARSFTQRTELLNDTITTSTQWSFQNANEPEDKGTVSSAFSSSKGHSLSITSATTATTGFSDWLYLIPGPQLTVGSRLILKVKVKLNDVTGNGVFIAMRGDTQSGSAFFVTSQGNQSITGSQDFKEYTIKLNYYPQNVSNIFIFLILDSSSTGTAYFDDIELVNYR